MTDNRQPTTDNRQPTTDDRLPMTDHRLPMTDHRLPMTDYRLPTTDNRQPTTGNRAAGATVGVVPTGAATKRAGEWRVARATPEVAAAPAVRRRKG
jgi:hypothetical protein